VNRRAARPVLITNAERSQEDQLRTRQNRYIAMMSLRMVCLVAAVVLASVQPPLVWLWVALCAAGMISLPWIAVVLANDRLPKERHRWRRHTPTGPQALPDPSGAPPGTDLSPK
jgi:L-asparagine transporter-like permease